MLDDMFTLSLYKEIATIDDEHQVYLVQHIETKRTFVKKILKIYNKDIFLKLKNMQIKGIPRIYEVCENNEDLIIIEEYISGKTVREIINEHNNAIPEATVTKYAIALCQILTELHSCNPPIIHRDIKPDNVIITDDERLFLIDLNAAKLENKEEDRDTQLLGTFGYLAPEQIGFGASSIQTDIFGLGKLMSSMLTGTPDNLNGYSGRLTPIIEKCLKLDSQNRYSSALELENALKGKESVSQFTPKRIVKKICLGLIIAVGVYYTARTTINYFINDYTVTNREYQKQEHYQNAEDFEYGLSQGADMSGVYVTFEVANIIKSTDYQTQLVSLNNLMFNVNSFENDSIEIGDYITLKITTARKRDGIWDISGSICKDASLGDSLTEENATSDMSFDEKSKEYIESCNSIINIIKGSSDTDTHNK